MKMIKYNKVKPEDLVVGKEYSQKDSDTSIKGEVKFVKEELGKYTFEDMRGILHDLTLQDLEVNPMYATALTLEAIRKARRELSKGTTKYNHDPIELIREAHLKKYGSRPNYTSIGEIQEDDTYKHVLGYRANINGMDYLLLLKKNGKKVSYTDYAYGMVFEKEDKVTITAESLLASGTKNVGKKIRVDNDFCIYKGEKDGMFYFAPVSSANTFKNYSCTLEHVKVFGNIRKKESEKGIIQSTTKYQDTAKTREDKVIENAMHKEAVKIAKAQEKLVAPSIKKEFNDKLSEFSDSSDTASVFLNYSANRSVNSVKGTQLKAGEKYETPYGTMTYKGRVRKYGNKFQRYDASANTWVTDDNTNVNTVVCDLYAIGDLATAQSMERQTVLHEFNDGKGDVYFRGVDVQQGIITKEMHQGKEYSTPKGFTIYDGSTPVNYTDMVSKLRETIKTKFPNNRDTKANPVVKASEVRKVAKEGAMASDLYVKAVESFMSAIQYEFKDGNAYDYGYVVAGHIVEVLSPKHKEKLEKSQKIKNTKTTQRKVAIEVERNKRNAPEAMKDINKVSYKALKDGAYYTTDKGTVIYRASTDTKTINGSVKKIYRFYKPDGTLANEMLAEDIVKGSVAKMLIQGEKYWVGKGQGIFVGETVDANGNVYFAFDVNKPDYVYTTYKAVKSGSIQPVED